MTVLFSFITAERKGGGGGEEEEEEKIGNVAFFFLTEGNKTGEVEHSKSHRS